MTNFILSEGIRFPMKERSLGSTGVKVSPIGLGCWALGGNSYGNIRDEESLGALETAWDSGANFYDTADVYGEGHSENLIGKFLKGKPRDKIFVATKAGWDFYPADRKPFQRAADASGKISHAGHHKNFEPAYLRFACEQSLRRLGTEAIDLYQLHNPSLEQIQRGEAVGVLEKLKKEGKIRFLGISVHTEAEALAAIEDPRMEALQVIFNLLDQRMKEKVFSEAQRKRVGILAREPLASGLLTGKYAPSHEFPKNDHRRRWNAEKREIDWKKIRLLQDVLKDQNISLQQAALEYILAFEAVTVVIPGAKTPAQVTGNLQASAAPRLTAETVLALRELYGNELVFKQGLIPR